MNFKCEPCNLVFTGPIPYEAHMCSAKHEKIVKKLENIAELHSTGITSFKCEPCNIVFTGPIPYETHMYSAKHEKIVKKMGNTAELHSTGNMNFKCEPCNMVFTGPIPYQAHRNSEKHENIVKKFQNIEEMCENMTADVGISDKKFQNIAENCEKMTQNGCMSDPYIKVFQNEYKCILCNITLNSLQQAELHSSGKKHSKFVVNKKFKPNSSEYVSCTPEVSSYKPTSTEKSFNSPFIFHDPKVENLMADIKVFTVDDPVCF